MDSLSWNPSLVTVTMMMSYEKYMKRTNIYAFNYITYTMRACIYSSIHTVYQKHSP